MLTVNSTVHEFVQLQADAFRLVNSPKTIQQGVWYPMEYIDALLADEQERNGPRVTWMREKNICNCGLVPKSFVTYPGHLFTFIARADLVASEALKQLSEGLSLLECGTALQLTQWIALNDYLGSTYFNALLSLPRNIFPPMYLQYGAHILSKFYRAVEIQDETQIVPGDICLFKNASSYNEKHPRPLNLAYAYNTVCVGQGKYMGLGLDLEGNSSAEIEKVLFDEYNKESRDRHLYLPEQEAQKVKVAKTYGQISWEEFQKLQSEDPNGVRGRLVLKVQRLCLDRLEQLKSTPPDQLRKLVKSWG